eukprot:8848364-Karenia_brevis.AAC.1
MSKKSSNRLTQSSDTNNARSDSRNSRLSRGPWIYHTLKNMDNSTNSDQAISPLRKRNRYNDKSLSRALNGGENP